MSKQTQRIEGKKIEIYKKKKGENFYVCETL